MAALTKNDFDTLMQQVCPEGGPDRIAVACSGGPDSMVLALFMKDWAVRHGHQMVALIVDHRLRDNSTTEAKLVQGRLQKAGIETHILTRSGAGSITSDIQNQARNLRYHLLSDWCVANNFQNLAVGHHREDQAETFLLRLARGSGVDGLSAMGRRSDLGKVTLLRPLLDISKSDILVALAKLGVDAVLDPSNTNEDFDRVKMRNRQAVFDEVGLTAKRLADTAKNMARAREALEQMTASLLGQAATLHPEGYITLKPAPVIAAPEEISLRALSAILSTISGRDYPPRLEQVERLYGHLVQGTLAGGCTLAGCGVTPKSSYVLFYRENSAISDVQPASSKVIWDRRYLLKFDGVEPSLEVRNLGADGWQKLKQYTDFKSELPAVVRNGLPALWQGDTLLSVPHLQGLAHAQKFGLMHIRFLGAKNFRSSPFSSSSSAPI